jgi:hypothetical protein
LSDTLTLFFNEFLRSIRILKTADTADRLKEIIIKSTPLVDILRIIADYSRKIIIFKYSRPDIVIENQIPYNDVRIGIIYIFK